MYRNTYAEINVNNICNNVRKIINKYNNYDYYFGVVKADSYGHNNLDVVKAIIEGGSNYLAVATLEEAIEIREEIKDIPILCLGIIPTKFLDIAFDNNITITVNSYEYAKGIVDSGINVVTHIKINSGMNRLGISNKDEFVNTVNLLLDNNIVVEGIYTHIYNASNRDDTIKQFNIYDSFVNEIDKSKIKIFHVAASDTLVSYDKLDYINGCRLGIIMYGFTGDKSLDLQSSFSLYSEIIQINHLSRGDRLGYGGIHVAEEDEVIGVVPIGYADGIIRKNTGRYVYINNKRYQIVGNICMDMLFVKIDDSINLGDKVVLLKDVDHIMEVSKYLDTIPYEVLCTISKRVPRIIK